MTMDHDASISWSEHLQEESLMSTGNEDEFSNFLEFGINFPDLEGHGSTPPQHQRALQNTDNHIPTTMAQNTVNRMDTDPTTQPPQYASIVGDHLAMNLHDNGTVPSQAFHYSHEHQSQHHHQHQHQRHPHHQPQKHTPLQHSGNHNYSHGQTVIPPTPNSIELHGGAARYPQRVEQGHDMYERYDDQGDFYTPLVSPAMTPLESQFRLPEYTIPGEYFTPLTSPALEAQNSNPNGYPFQTTQAPSAGYVQSPNINPSATHVTSAPSSPGVRRKQRRRPSVATARAGGRAAKASPSIQPKNRRKQALSAQLADDVTNALGQDHGVARPATSGGSSLRYGSHESSGQDSVSPEPISEPLMPPPALPQTRRSPAVRPQIVERKTSEPATPATLMRIQNRQHLEDPSGQFSGYSSVLSSEHQDEPMEDVMLPEAVMDTRPRVTRIDTAVNAKVPLAPASSKSTPSTEPRSSSERPSSGSITPSPHAGAVTSPGGSTPRKSENKAPTARKRQSVSSSHASPALRPRISPSIQPSVRGESGLTSETSALYLASKSNYQHILDGTLLPGVSYPETLAENLSSKRTNHKLAEQGRRNRINTALKEIETLLPPGFAQERSKDRTESRSDDQGTPNTKNGDKEKEKNNNQTISKASTVEMAIDYIKALKQELDETKAQLKAAESKLSGQDEDRSDVENNADCGTGSEAETRRLAEKTTA